MDPEIDALKRQLQTLQASYEAGTVDADAYRQERDTLEKRIVERVMAGAPPVQRAPRKLLAGVAAAVLVVAVAGYAWTGSPNALSQQAVAGGPPGADQIAAMIGKLEQRLKEQPNDAEGWSMLARSYLVLERPADAVTAYKRAVALRGDDPALLVDYADALAVASGRKLAGEPMALVNQALKIDPNNLKALALAGSAAFEQKDFAGAVRHWEHLAAAAPPGSDFLSRVEAGIAEARQLGGLPPAKVASAPAVAAAGATVAGTVTLAASLRSQAAPDDTVFVYARAAEGPRMPLAIVRKQVKDLPFDFQLDDSSAMSPATKLSAFPRVVITARISKSGNAVPQPGDLAGQTEAVALGARGLKIEISKPVN
jgi:cytochrome c-type biogenesis protein CcmH